jgi:putative glycerol-1-phosphate prenyltransferase
MGGIAEKIEQVQGKKKFFAVLVDPDKVDENRINQLVSLSLRAGVDFFLVGGSLLTQNTFEKCILLLKQQQDIPVILFPGNMMQINNNADAILFLSLISGRNPDFLIGKHVIAAPVLKNSKLEIIPTGYMLINSGRLTTAAYMSNTMPIPSEKTDIAVCTAIAGAMLGLKMMYLDAGSGAECAISPRTINAVKSAISIPVFVGGGICTAKQAQNACDAGADVVVVGNAIEKSPALITEIANAIKM